MVGGLCSLPVADLLLDNLNLLFDLLERIQRWRATVHPDFQLP
jgi:hypothetical protein